MDAKSQVWDEHVFEPNNQPSPSLYDDPLAQDDEHDLVVSTTRRGLCRLTLLAAEVGARFEREGAMHDPMAWLLAPRQLFGGAAAIDACVKRPDFLRAIILHGLSIGLDACPEAIDALLQDDSFPASFDQDNCGGNGGNDALDEVSHARAHEHLRARKPQAAN